MVVIVAVGFRIVRQAVGQLVDAARLDPSSVKEVGLCVEGVHRVRQVRSRGLDSAVWVDLTVLVAASRTVADAHRIAHSVEAALRAKFPQVVDVVVHVEPDH